MKLNDIKEWLIQNKWGVITGVSVIVIGAVVVKVTRKKKKEWPKDTVILHQVGRGDFDLSLTPFGVKLEAYFRMAGIPYINNDTREPSSKGKTPWIEINGQGVADSSFIIEYLNEKYAVDLNMGLTPAEKGIGRAFCKMVDEHLYWIMIMSRWYHDVYDVEPVGLGIIPSWMLPFLARKVFKHGWAQGVGRHSREENNHLMYGDLKAISDFLGEKLYLFGDKPCEVDCVVFGQLTEFCWHMPNLYGEKLVNEIFPNLRNYCYRMKKAFWPDLGTGAMSKKQKQSWL